jgi:hypothetical protein
MTVLVVNFGPRDMDVPDSGETRFSYEVGTDVSEAILGGDFAVIREAGKVVVSVTTLALADEAVRQEGLEVWYQGPKDFAEALEERLYLMSVEADWRCRRILPDDFEEFESELHYPAPKPRSFLARQFDWALQAVANVIMASYMGR